MYCTSQFQVENNNTNDMPSIIFRGEKNLGENHRLRNDTRTSSPFEFVNWPWKKKPRKTTAVSRNSRLVFPPDPPSSRLPSPSYNTTTRYARTRVVYFCDPSNSEWDIELLQLRVLCLATFILTIAMWNSTKKEVSVPNFLSLYAAAATPWKKKNKCLIVCTALYTAL